MAFVIFLFIFLFSVEGAFAQRRNNRNNLNNINNRDNQTNRSGSPSLELTDEEVNQYWLRVQALGYKLEEIPELALSQGFSERHATQLYNRIVRMQRVSRRNQAGRDEESIALFELDQDSIAELELRERIFGMDVFERAFLTSFRPDINIATPESYVIGPGDLLTVVVYGTSQELYRLEVNPQGDAIIPLVGPVHLSGLQLAAARESLKNGLSKIYAGLRGSNPSVSIDLTLDVIRTIRINIVGEIERPGTYEVPSYSGVFNALYSAGGPTTNGTFRNIKVFRGGKPIYNVDLYKYLVYGEVPSSYNLEDDDIIVVDTYDKRIEIIGEVRREGYFEILNDESLQKIVAYAGGFTASANTENFLIESYNGRFGVANDYPLNLNQTYDFNDGDVLTFRTVNSIGVNRVQIDGPVVSPGIYRWFDGLTLDSLIQKSGGLLPNAFTEKVTVYRLNRDMSTSAIPLTGQELNAFLLQQGDVVSIRSNQELTETRFVQISGEVNETGIFPYYQGMTIGDLLLLTGGLKNSAINGVIELARRTFEQGRPSFEIVELDGPASLTEADLSALDYGLQPFDHVFVRPSAGFQSDAIVSITGEVNHPGEYVISSSDVRISDILTRAGGFTDYAFTEGVALLRRIRDDFREQQELRDEIVQLERLKGEILDEQGVFLNASSEEEINVLDERINNLRQTYEDLYLTTEDGIARLLTVDPGDGVSFNNRSYQINRRDRRDRIGIDIKKITENPGGNYDFVLQPGDIIEVPRNQETVRIRGRVQYNTSTKYEASYKFKDYISQAGGYEINAKRGLAYVIYANGDAKKVKNFLFFKRWPEIRPGSEIVVPPGRIRQVFNPERIVALTSSLLTTFLVIDNFLNSN